MSSPQRTPHRRRLTRPIRRVRRWARHTPTRTMALTISALGLTLVLVAGIVWALS